MDINKLSKLKQSAPEIPTNTCPYIDFIEEIIKEVIDECDSSFIEQKLELAISALEYVRESNDALRQSTKYWYNEIK